MARILKAAALGLLVAGLGATQARAEVSTFAQVGSWKAFGGTSTNGKMLCGMSSSSGGKWFGVKYFKGNSNFTVQLSNKSWTVKDGSKVSLSMRFDRESPWRATATTFHMSDGDPAIEFEVGRDQMGNWLREFRGAQTLVLSFPNADVSDWRADLTGTDRIAGEMQRCMQMIGN